MRRDVTTSETTEETFEQLLDEIEHYLEAIEVFRAEGAEPAWLDDEALPTWWLEEMCLPREPASTEALV